MKIIGTVSTLDKDENGEYLDTAYMGGAIIMLNETETRLLKLLQDAWNGETFRHNARGYNPQSKDMSNAFKAINSFVEAKFVVNEFRVMVDNLDSMLLEKGQK